MKRVLAGVVAIINWDGIVYCPNCKRQNVVFSVVAKPERIRCNHCSQIFFAKSEKP